MTQLDFSSPGKPPQPPTPSQQPNAQSSAGGKKSSSSQKEGSVKETIESILVAFILAFIFRAFVVEAFVIPTGSMAPTLLGAHMRFRCNDCGYAFDHNYSAPPRDDGEIVIGATSHLRYYRSEERRVGKECRSRWSAYH